MKKNIALIALSLFLFTACSQKEEQKKISANQTTVENFVGELKDIERPAAEQFNIFLTHIDSISKLDSSRPKKELDSLL